MKVKAGIAAAVLLGLGACNTIDPSSRKISGDYFGWVRIRQTSADHAPRVGALDSKVLGVRVENGLSIGYSARRRYEIPPDCRMVIIVRDRSELDFVKEQIGNFKEGICATIGQS